MDSRIALGIKPIEIPDQAQAYQRALTLEHLMGQNDLNRLKVANAPRELAIAEAKAGLDARASQLGIEGKQVELMSGLAASIVNAPPEQQPIIYPQMAAEWKRLGLPNSDKVPDQWSPEFLPHLTQIAARGQTPDKAMERADIQASAPPAPQSSPAYSALSGVDSTSGAITRPADLTQPEGSPIAAALMKPQGPQTGTGWMGGAQPGAAPNSMTLPTETVTANRPQITPDDWRKEGARLTALGRQRGSAALIAQAKDAYAEADRMDAQIFKERDQSKPGNIPAGVIWNPEKKQYEDTEGKRLSSQEVQAIDAASGKARASNVTVGNMSPENAAKTELLNQGIADMAEFKGLIMPDGKVDRQIVLGMSTPGMAGIPGTDSRIAYSLIYNAIEAKLRAESGAAVPEQEVKRMAARFIPSPLDSDATIFSKVRRMEAFLRGSFGRVKGAGEPSTPAEGPRRREADKNPPKILKWDDIK